MINQLVAVTCVGDASEISGFWFWPGPTLKVTSAQTVTNKWTIYMYTHMCVFVCVCFNSIKLFLLFLEKPMQQVSLVESFRQKAVLLDIFKLYKNFQESYTVHTHFCSKKPNIFLFVPYIWKAENWCVVLVPFDQIRRQYIQPFFLVTLADFKQNFYN